MDKFIEDLLARGYRKWAVPPGSLADSFYQRKVDGKFINVYVYDWRKTPMHERVFASTFGVHGETENGLPYEISFTTTDIDIGEAALMKFYDHFGFRKEQ